MCAAGAVPSDIGKLASQKCATLRDNHLTGVWPDSAAIFTPKHHVRRSLGHTKVTSVEERGRAGVGGVVVLVESVVVVVAAGAGNDGKWLLRNSRSGGQHRDVCVPPFLQECVGFSGRSYSGPSRYDKFEEGIPVLRKALATKDPFQVISAFGLSPMSRPYFKVGSCTPRRCRVAQPQWRGAMGVRTASIVQG